MLLFDGISLGEDEEVEMEDYFIPVSEVSGLGKRQREDSEDVMDVI